MQWLDRARAILRPRNALSLPDPDRIDVGSVPDTALLLRAIDAAMPPTAFLQLIGPRHQALLPFLAVRSIAMRGSTGEYFVSLADGAVTELARVAARCPPHDVCTHLFVHDGGHTLLEAFGRDRGEDIVWLSQRVPRARLRRFLEVISAAPRPTADHAPRRIVRSSRATEHHRGGSTGSPSSLSSADEPRYSL